MSEDGILTEKPELLNWLQQENQQWEVLLAQIGLMHMNQSGVNGDWSMKDIVAHLTGWNRWLVARLQAAQRREPEPPPPWPAHLQTDDEINAWLPFAPKTCPTDQVEFSSADRGNLTSGMVVLMVEQSRARFVRIGPHCAIRQLLPRRSRAQRAAASPAGQPARLPL